MVAIVSMDFKDSMDSIDCNDSNELIEACSSFKCNDIH